MDSKIPSQQGCQDFRCFQCPNLATSFCLSKAQEYKRQDGREDDSSGGPSLSLFHWEEAVHEHSYPLSDFGVAWKGSGVPEFVVSKFLTPFFPAHHLLPVPVASWFSDPSAGLRWTHPRLSSACATVFCSALPPLSALPGLKRPSWREFLPDPWGAGDLTSGGNYQLGHENM